jgi:cell division protein FtsB
MQADIDSMGVRIGQLQEKNFKLEEKMNALLDEIAMLNDELESKGLLIKFVPVVSISCSLRFAVNMNVLLLTGDCKRSSLLELAQQNLRPVLRRRLRKRKPAYSFVKMRLTTRCFFIRGSILIIFVCDGQGVVTNLFSPSKTESSTQTQVNSTMNTLLEETLLKNMHLQDDLASLATQLEVLSKENKRLKTTLDRERGDGYVSPTRQRPSSPPKTSDELPAH